MSKECQICTSVKKTVFACPYCAYESCQACNERMILDSINPPSCAACRREWSSDFFYSVFSRSFLTTRYKQHREKLLYEREKSLLPATQPQVARAKRKMETEQELQQCRRQINEARRQIRALTYTESVLRHRIHQLDQTDTKSSVEKKEDTYVGPCPVTDCRGFLNTTFVCGLCSTKVCPDCREKVDEEKKEEKKHECNPDTVATIRELAKTTKHCPNCHAPIFKIDGCDQMWCVKCNVAFSWQTGRVQNGAIHNPHYFEYLRTRGGQLPRNPNEVLCGGLPPAEFLMFIRGWFERNNTRGQTYSHYITDIYRAINHIRHVILPSLPGPFDNVTNQDLRVQFLLNQVTEDEFKVKLQRREKDRNKRLEQRTILETYCNVVQDLFTKLYTEGVNYLPYASVQATRFWSEKDAEVFIKEERDVRMFTREAYQKLNAKYDSNITCPI